MALYFYDAQRSGKLPEGFRVKWRGDSAMEDGSDVGVDLTGGFYDAGDHVKFALPMASAMTLLSWGGIEYGDGYHRARQKGELLSLVRWGADWLMKAHPSEDVFYAQVGNGALDHDHWGPAEAMTMKRPAYKIDSSKPGSDVAAEASAALASAAILFKSEDPEYSQKLLRSARSLFALADNHRGRYSKVIHDAAEYYSSAGYLDELIWAAAWLYRATRDPIYLQKAETYYQRFQDDDDLHWTQTWDDKIYGASVLLAELTGKDIYKDATERWLNFWTVGDNGKRVKYTPGGLAWLDRWGSLRYAANTAFLAFIYADRMRDHGTRYRDFARSQINYILGDNPEHRSYVVGFGLNPPRNPHHAGAHGSLNDDIDEPGDNRNILYGALVGGPSAPKDDAYVDRRSDYVTNEVSLDYNAGFTGALARMVLEYGGAPLEVFPPSE